MSWDEDVTLQTLVPKRLEKNAKLHRELQIGYSGDRFPCTRTPSSRFLHSSRKAFSGTTGEQSLQPLTALPPSLSGRTASASWAIS
jgi:hypothetical protein